MKIAFLCNEFPPRPHGGIGTFVESVTHGLAERGHPITVISLGNEQSIENVGPIRVINLLADRRPLIGNLINRLRLRKCLSRLANDGEIDLVETPDYMGLLPFGLKTCPVVVRLHITDTSIKQAAGMDESPGIQWYERRNLAVNGNWIGVSKYIFDLTRNTFSIDPKFSAVIYNPVPTAPTKFFSIENLPADYILYAGALSHRKGAQLLAEAVKPLLEDFPELHLVYAGMATDENGRLATDEIREILGTTDKRVLFLGRVPRETVMGLMKRARVFAFPSRLEALGIVVLEAMSSGVPVVCTSYPPGPEMVEDEVTGILACPYSPHEFREAIRRILTDPALAATLADNAKRSVNERFTLKECVDLTEEFYEACVERWAAKKHRLRVR